MDAEWMNYILAIISGLCAAIPLVIQLVKYVKAAAKEGNWKDVIDLVMKLMEQAETMFENGDDRKTWVMNMLKASADQINFDINYDVISDMIDALCKMSKKVNAPSKDSTNGGK